MDGSSIAEAGTPVYCQPLVDDYTLAMILRFLHAAALVLLALLVLAWPLSFPGVGYFEQRATMHSSLGVQSGVLWVKKDVIAGRAQLERDQYQIRTVPPMGTAAVFTAPSITLGPSWQVTVPLLLLAAVSATVLAGSLVRIWRRKTLRRRRGMCVVCGYPRTGAGTPCAECGLKPDVAESKAGPAIGLLIADAGVGLFLSLAAISSLVGVVHLVDSRTAAVHRFEGFDYSWYLDKCQPWLDGKVLVVAPGSRAHLAGAMAGCTIVLLPGNHDGLNLNGLHDLLVVGAGRDSTTVKLVQLGAATRMRIENLTIDCGDTPFASFRQGGSLYLKECRVKNYNSGAGGSNSIFSVDGILLTEGCEFEGNSGRSGGSGNGNAMDLRVANRVFIRGTEFNNNAEIFRNADGVFDHCTFTGEQVRIWPPRGDLMARATQFPLGASGGPPTWRAYVEGFDDLPVVQRLSGAASTQWADPLAQATADSLDLADNLLFWRRLMAHPSPHVRLIAAKRIGLPAAATPAVPLQTALSNLATTPEVGPPSPPMVSSDDALAILSMDSRDALKAMGNSNTAAGLLQLSELQPSLPEMVRFSKVR